MKQREKSIKNMPEHKSLPGSFFFLREAWKEYTARMATYLAIAALPLAVNLFFDGFRYAFESAFFPGAVFSAVDFLCSIIVSAWSYASLLFVVKDRKEGIDFKEALERGWTRIVPFFWISSFVFAAVLGGTIFFIIPGVIFSVWFLFSACVLVAEGKKGVSAMKRSRQLVKGRWWDVFLKVLMWMLLFILAVIAVETGSFISFGQASPEWVSEMASLFLIPFYSIYVFLIYEKARDSTVEV